MIKQEKINRRRALLRVDGNISKLKEKEQTLASVYEIIFSRPNFTFLEVLNSYSYKSISYGEADKVNKKFANYFKSIISEQTKYVGLLLDNSKEWIYSFFGLILAGFVPVLLSTANAISDAKFAISKLNIKYVVTDKDVGDVKIINPFDSAINDYKDNGDFSPSNEIVFLTSGTTGTPKIVIYEGKEVCSQLYNAAEIIKHEKNIGKAYKGYLKQLVILPFYHMFGLFAVLLWFSFFNITFVLPIDLSPLSIRQACLLREPSHIFAVPLFWETIENEIYRFIKDHNIEKKFNKGIKLSGFLQSKFGNLGTNFVINKLFKKYLKNILGNSIRFCISGGAFISNETLKLINSLGYQLCNGYGTTEIGITSFSKASSFKDRCINSIGNPFELIEYKIENNELFVRGSSISKHIIDENNERYFKDDEFVNSHDYVAKENGTYYVKGRIDEIVIASNGENISLASLENSISLNHSSEYALITKKDKQIVLVIAYSKSIKLEDMTNDINNVKGSEVGKHIADYYVSYRPLPKANGLKIKRNELAELINDPNSHIYKFSELIENSDSLLNEINQELTNIIVEAFKSVFTGQDINKDSNFRSDLGGDSFRYFVLVSEIEKRVGVKINLAGEVNVPQTPLEFARYIESK